MISKRLLSCLSYVNGFLKLADIGCDHAYTSIFAVTNGFVKKAIGIENKKGPYERAINNVIKYNLSDRIEIILSDGIKDIKNADCVLIAGMGGILIFNILSTNINNLNNVKRLVLQPNTDANYVRLFASQFNFKIIYEEIVYDKHFYEIIVLEKGISILNEIEIKYGPQLLKNPTENFILLMKKRKKDYEKIFKSHPDDEIKKAITEIDSILKKIQL